jgi:hypothetical protein
MFDQRSSAKPSPRFGGRGRGGRDRDRRIRLRGYDRNWRIDFDWRNERYGGKQQYDGHRRHHFGRWKCRGDERIGRR